MIRNDTTAAASDVYAIALTIGGNEDTAGESIVVRGDGFEVRFDNTPVSGFVGFLAPFPIINVHFDEDAGGDDMVIRDFRFGSN